MGLFDAITGGAAQVWVEYPRHELKPGEQILVKVTVQPRSNIKSNGVFVDLMSEEDGYSSVSSRCHRCGHHSRSHAHVNNRQYYQEIPLTGPMQFQENFTQAFQGYINIPPNAQPTYIGTISHKWSVRGRVEAFGNDPDSGFQPIVVR